MTDPVSLDVHTNPEAHDPDGRIPADMAVSPALQAIETALTAAPGRGTVEAKAQHIHDHLARNGWALIPEAAAAEGNVHVLGPDEQIVTVPDGYDVTVTRIAIDGPSDQLIDPELSELVEIVARLEGLDAEARERVAGFVTHRYGPAGPPSPPPTWGQPWYRPVQQAPGQGFATGGVIGRPQATRISE